MATSAAKWSSAHRKRGGNPHRLATLVYNLVSTTVHTELLAQESAQPDPAHQAQLAADIWEFCRRAIVA
jgi:hypothetical protein